MKIEVIKWIKKYLKFLFKSKDELLDTVMKQNRFLEEKIENLNQ